MGIIFKGPGYLLYIVAGLWGLIIQFQIVEALIGTFWAFVSFIFAPIFLMLAPLWAGFVDTDWLPALIVYGGGFAAYSLIAIGGLIDGD